MIPWSRIDEIEENIQPWVPINPTIWRETFIELIRAVNELEARIDNIERRLNDRTVP